MGTSAMINNGALDYLSGGAALSSPNVAALGYLPRSMIFITTGQYAGQLRFKQRFTYTATFKPLAKSTTATVLTQIQNDSDFVWISTAIDIRSTDDFTTFIQPNVAPFMVTFTDSASGNNLMDAAVPVGNLFGNAGAPYVSLGVPYILRRGGAISTTLTNNDTGNDRNVRIAFQGFKVYDIPGA